MPLHLHQHQHHLHTEPAAPSPEPEAIVPRVSAALAQVPRLQQALLHRLLPPLLASWTRQPHPAHLYVGQSAGLAHHAQEPSHSAGDSKDIIEYRDTWHSATNTWRW